MKVLITGATGLIGQKLIEQLMLDGYEDIHVLSRNVEQAQASIPFPVKAFQWNPAQKEIDTKCFEGIDVIVHLAGENIADEKWTATKKRKILNSRVDNTKFLIKNISNLIKKPKKIISASAIGIYGNRGDEKLTESSQIGEGFLTDVCIEWENSVLNHNIKDLTAVCLRTGMVLANEGGALKKMLTPFLLGVGGILGSGKQYMSWVHIDDIVGMYQYLIENDVEKQVFNGTAPNPVTNYQFTKTLGQVIRRPTVFPVPSIALKLLLGEMSQVALQGQQVLPKNFSKNSYKFKFENLLDAFNDLLSDYKNGETTLKKYQWVNIPTEHLFSYFCDVKNLESITPKNLQIKVIGENLIKIEYGTQLKFKLKFYNFPIKWKAKISEFEENKSFTGELLSGPYKKWIHIHGFMPLKKGTLIKDTVVYKVPLGRFFNLAIAAMVKKDVEKILNYRKNILHQIFHFK